MNKYLVIIILLFISKAEAQNVSALVVGDSLFVLGDYSKAITIYKQKEDDNLFKIAKCYDAIGNSVKAKNYYEKIIVQEPKNTQANYNYAKLLFKTSKFTQASKIFKNLSDEHPNNPNFVYQLALLKEKQKDTTAILFFQKTLAIDKNHINASYKIAKLHLEKRRFKKAIPHIEKGLEVDPISIRFLNLKALQHFYIEEYHKAIKTFKTLIKLGKKEEQIHAKLAICYTKVLDYERAIVQYHILIKRFDAKNSGYYYNLGICSMVLHYTEDAKKQFEQAIALKYTPLDKEYIALANLYKKQEQYKKALILYKRALRDNPKNETASYQIAVVTDNIEVDKKKVLRYYQKYLKIHGETGRMRNLAKARLSDLKKELHFKD